MARKKANYPLVEGLEITTLAAEGKAMGRWNDVVVFVPLTVPGDVVDVQIRSKRRRFMEGFVVRYVKKSPLRAEPRHGAISGSAILPMRVSWSRTCSVLKRSCSP